MEPNDLSMSDSDDIDFRTDEFAITIKRRVLEDNYHPNWSSSDDDIQGIELNADKIEEDKREEQCSDLDHVQPNPICVAIERELNLLEREMEQMSSVVHLPKSPRLDPISPNTVSDELEKGSVVQEEAVDPIGDQDSVVSIQVVSPRNGGRTERREEIENVLTSLQKEVSECHKALKPRKRPFLMLGDGTDDVLSCTTWDAIEISTCDLISVENIKLNKDDFETDLSLNREQSPQSTPVAERICRYWVDSLWDSRDTSTWREAAGELIRWWMPICCTGSQ